ncbi:MAG TPA: ABC transporter permease [Ktedonobacteraceae bacterium]|jgi:peptide/nickel transport system permease protein|nr:ABC transporter permease [Ktedonobacteraceae bacterium]
MEKNRSSERFASPSPHDNQGERPSLLSGPMGMSAGDSLAVVAALPRRKPIYAAFAEGLRRFWKLATINRKVALGSAIIAFFILVAIFGPMFPLQDPNAISHLSNRGPSAAHWLGTSTSGQDLFSQLVYGTRSSIFWSFFTGLLVTAVSAFVGLIAGYAGGVLSEVLSMLINVFLVVPALPLAVVLAAYFPRGPLTIAVVITVTSWAYGARLLRSQTLSMRSREFVTAARASGESTWRIIFYEILPNEASIVATIFITTTIAVVLFWASLQFLGLADVSDVNWGSMLYWAQQADGLFQGFWWWFVPPGLCIAILAAGLSLINFGIDEISDPRLGSAVAAKRVRRVKRGTLSGGQVSGAAAPGGARGVPDTFLF